jgi:hypothetical protein
MLLSTGAAHAQTKPATSLNAGIIKLDAKNGFRSYRFGTAIEKVPGLHRIDNTGIEGSAYDRPAEPMGVGPVHLNSLLFVSLNGRLAGFVLTCFGVSNGANLLAVLQEQYGPGLERLNGNITWPGKRVVMDYTVADSKCTVTIMSKTLGTSTSDIKKGVKDL